MSKIQPVTTSAEIIDRLDATYAQNSSLLTRDSLVYRSIIRDCERLKQADAHEGWVAQGLCELLVGDEEAFRSCFDIARPLAGSSIDNCEFMFAQGLHRIGRNVEALEIFRTVAAPERGFFGDRAAVGHWIGAFGTLMQMYKRATEMKLDFNSETDFDLVARVAEVLRANTVSDAEVAEYLDCAELPICKRRLIQKSHSAEVMSLDGQDTVLLTLHVDTDGKTLADMTFELAERIAELPTMHSALHVSYRAV